MKNSIGWHKECLKNMTDGLERKHKAMIAAKQDFYMLESDVLHLTRQIRRAELLGKDGFDCERFMPKTDAKKELELLWSNRPQT